MDFMKNLVFMTALALTTPSAIVQAQTAPEFPSKVVTIVVPAAPGGSYDYIGRLLGEGLSRELGQPVVVENRPGAGTVVGTQYVVKSAADGYTIVVGGVGSIAQAAAVVKDLPYSPGKDLVPLQVVSTNSFTLAARPDFPPKNLQELIAYARANPGKLTIGTTGQGTGQTVAASLLKSLAAIDIVEVQYKGAPPAYIDLMAGRIDLFFDGTGTTVPFIKSGKVRGIASSGAERDLGEVPTTKESGLPGLVLDSWTGLFAPAATPRSVVLRLRQAIDKVAASPEFRKQMASRSFEVLSLPDVDAFVKAEIRRWPPLLAKAGIKPQ